MKQLYSRLKKLEARVPAASADPFAEVFALSLSRLSNEQLDQTAEVLHLRLGRDEKELTGAQQAAWNQWETELAQAARELHCTTLLKTDDLRARA